MDLGGVELRDTRREGSSVFSRREPVLVNLRVAEKEIEREREGREREKAQVVKSALFVLFFSNLVHMNNRFLY